MEVFKQKHLAWDHFAFSLSTNEKRLQYSADSKESRCWENTQFLLYWQKSYL